MALQNSIFKHPDFASLIDKVKEEVERKKRPAEEVIYDDVNLQEVLNASKRLTSEWRKKGLITFSKVGGKIYYRLSDILAFLKKFEVPAVDSNLKIQL